MMTEMTAGQKHRKHTKNEPKTCLRFLSLTMHLPDFNQSFRNNEKQRGIGGSNHQQRGIGGSHGHQRGIGGSNQRQRGIGGNNQQQRGIGENKQRQRGIRGNNQRQRGIGGNNQRAIQARRFHHAHISLEDDSLSGFEINEYTNKNSRLATFLKSKKWYLLVGMLLLFSAIIATVFVMAKDDGGGSSAQLTNVGGNVPTVAPEATEGSEIPTSSTGEAEGGDQQPSISPGAAPTRAPLLRTEGFTLLGEATGSGYFSISSTMSGDGTTAAVARGMAEGESSARRMNSWSQMDASVIVSVFRYDSTGVWARVGDDLVFLVGSRDIDAVGKLLALSENGNILAIGFFSERCDDLTEKCGHVRVYSYQNDAWTQFGRNITGDVSNGFFGWSVAISDDGVTVAAGAPQSPGGGGLVRSGKVRVFRLDNAQWRQLGPDLEGGGAMDQLGSSLALSGDGSYLVSGAVQGLTASLGYAKVFKFEASTDSFIQVGDNIEGDGRTNKFGTACRFRTMA